MLNVWIGNLGKYNEGELVGEWLKLPVSKQELDTFLREKVGLQLTQAEVDKALEEEGVCYEEYMINDYETDLPIKISEYENLDNLNLLATIAENVNDMDAINAYVDSQGEMTLEELANLMEQEDDIAYFRFSNDSSSMSAEEKMGYEMADATGLLSTLQKLQIEEFFDFEGYGSSWENGDITILDNGYIDFGDSDIDLNRYTLEELKEQYDLEETKKLKVIFKEVGKDPVVMEIDDTLEAKQKLVGGLIEIVPYKDDLLLVCNEEGKITNSKPNLQFDYDYIAGNCFIVGDDYENSGFKSIEESQVEDIKKDLEDRTIVIEELEEDEEMEEF
jgi:antirestriction protein